MSVYTDNDRSSAATKILITSIVINAVHTRMQTSGGESLLRTVSRSLSGSYKMLSDVLNGPAAIRTFIPSASLPTHIY